MMCVCVIFLARLAECVENFEREATEPIACSGKEMLSGR